MLPPQHQAITWTNADFFLTGISGAHFSEILIEIQTFSLKEIHLKILSAYRWPFSSGLTSLNKNDILKNVISLILIQHKILIKVPKH